MDCISANQTGSKGGTKLYLNGEEVSRDDPTVQPAMVRLATCGPSRASGLSTRRSQQDKPFFLYLAHAAPHFPCMAPEATIAKYRGKYMEGWDKLREQRYQATDSTRA